MLKYEGDIYNLKNYKGVLIIYVNLVLVMNLLKKCFVK